MAAWGASAVHDADRGVVEAVAATFSALAARVEVPLPTPATLLERWLWLAEVAAVDLSVARLFEGHVDAVAILAEAGRSAEPGRRYGVWASRAGGARVEAREAGCGLVLDGVAPYASGAHTVDVALVTVETDGGTRLTAVDTGLAGFTVDEGSWPALGMAGSDSATVRFAGVRVAADCVVGPPGFYLDRLGFWLGAVGVAACWLGGAVGVLQPLVQAAVDRRLDDHGLAFLGRAWADLSAAMALLATTAGQLGGSADDGAGADDARRTAETVRAVSERAASATIDAVARGLGPGPLTGDGVHARRVADLGVYIRQHHDARDHAALGRLLGTMPW